MVFSSTKVANICQQGKQALLFIGIDLIMQIIIRTAQQWRIIGASFRIRTDIANLISFLVKYVSPSYKWNISLTKETSNAFKLSNL